ncbi:MAG TPA: HlyD family efflux transporter periplasmic adaptor subunit [Pseudonocardia sp.]|nr:HlyD family efflux transporter periplasmic adaptor subunit [Pseudonocardia sp.]
MAEREDASSTRTEGASSMNGQAPAGSEPPEAEFGSAGGSPEAPAKRQLKPKARLALIVAGIVAGIAVLGGGVAYFLYTNQFVTTDNAQVDGDQIQINAPTTGTVVDLHAGKGTVIRRNQPVGKIMMQGSGAQPVQIIRAPGDGTIAVNPVVNGQWVTAGTNIATAYNGDGIYVTARVDETDVADVHPGAAVDIDVDAYSGTEVTGIVQEIQNSAAAVFSLFPESNSSGNFQKVTQVIPVKIAFTNTGGVPLAPGMNVTVHIHKK